MAAVRLRDQCACLLADPDLCAIFKEAVLDFGGDLELRVD
jgi:hypothetical protein